MPWVPCVLARLVCLLLDQQMPVPSSQSVVWTAPARARRRPVRTQPAASGVAFASASPQEFLCVPLGPPRSSVAAGAGLEPGAPRKIRLHNMS